jgi:rubrerythrin
MDVHKIFEYALQREYEGKRFFEENAGRLSHASAVGAFKRLALEEQKHIEFIQRQISLMEKGQPASAALGEEMEKAGFFSRRADSEMIDQTVSEAMVPDLPVLRMAYLIERDFAEFYDLASMKTEGEARHILQMLSAWEHGHERLFKEMHDRAFEEYAQMPWGG